VVCSLVVVLFPTFQPLGTPSMALVVSSKVSQVADPYQNQLLIPKMGEKISRQKIALLVFYLAEDQ
jgi:hypothetical protein